LDDFFDLVEGLHVVFSFVLVLDPVLMLLSLLGLHVVGAVNVAGGVASGRVDHVSDTISALISQDPAEGFPADIALACRLVAYLELSSFAEAFHLLEGDGRMRDGVSLMCHGVDVVFSFVLVSESGVRPCSILPMDTEGTIGRLENGRLLASPQEPKRPHDSAPCQ
jgi:hypothetical protein